MSTLTAHPLTPDRWGAFVEVFGGGEGKGDCGRCWCQWWRLDRADFAAMTRTAMRELMAARVAAGPPPGLIGIDTAGLPVGWVQVGPRADVPGWNVAGRLTAPPDPAEATDPAVWGISCFVIRAGHRKRGHAGSLLEAAIAHARDQGARVLDACPVEPSRPRPATALYHGLASSFLRRGFVEIARRRPDRPLMRLDLAQ